MRKNPRNEVWFTLHRFRKEECDDRKDYGYRYEQIVI